MIKVVEIFKLGDTNFRTLKFAPKSTDKRNVYDSLAKESKLILIPHARIGLIVGPKKILPQKDSDFLGGPKVKKVELEISTFEEDQVLLGELDYFLTQRFRMKKIKVGDENIQYK